MMCASTDLRKCQSIFGMRRRRGVRLGQTDAYRTAQIDGRFPFVDRRMRDLAALRDYVFARHDAFQLRDAELRQRLLGTRRLMAARRHEHPSEHPTPVPYHASIVARSDRPNRGC